MIIMNKNSNKMMQEGELLEQPEVDKDVDIPQEQVGWSKFQRQFDTWVWLHIIVWTFINFRLLFFFISGEWKWLNFEDNLAALGNFCLYL